MLRTFPIFAVLFFVIPLIEIYLLVQVGGVIGVLPTILLVVLTAVLGAFLLRQQGLSTLARFQQSMGQGRLPATELLEGVILLVGGALLMTPGFFTDTMGFLCLLPPSRKLLVAALVKRVQIQGMHTQGTVYDQNSEAYTRSTSHSRPQGSSPHRSTTLEGEYVRKDEP